VSPKGVEPDSVVQLRRVIGRLARQLNASASVEGLTPSELSALGMIATRGTLSLAELTELEGLNPTMLSRVVSKLESLELAKRQRDPDNLRVVRVEVTAVGQRVHEQFTQQRSAMLWQSVAKLKPEHIAAVFNALPALDELAAELQANRAQPTIDAARRGSD
jgi:DNA-binding MarR family transcriptional regulator